MIVASSLPRFQSFLGGSGPCALLVLAAFVLQRGRLSVVACAHSIRIRSATPATCSASWPGRASPPCCSEKNLTPSAQRPRGRQTVGSAGGMNAFLNQRGEGTNTITAQARARAGQRAFCYRSEPTAHFHGFWVPRSGMRACVGGAGPGIGRGAR
jgi:hypothetical protein